MKEKTIFLNSIIRILPSHLQTRPNILYQNIISIQRGY